MNIKELNLIVPKEIAKIAKSNLVNSFIYVSAFMQTPRVRETM